MDLFSSTSEQPAALDASGEQRAHFGAAHPPTGGVQMLAASHPAYRERQIPLLHPDVIATVMAADATAMRVMAKGARPQLGDLVGVRLNLNIHKKGGICMHTIHRGGVTGGHRQGRGFWNGSVLHYAQTVVLRDAFFNVHQPGREAIASGQQAKHPMASIDGHLELLDAPCRFDGVEVSFNPKREHLFVDETGRALWYAQDVTIVAHRAYARGLLVFHDVGSAPLKGGTAPSRAWF